jgi:pSer/pThr/pTyr-binding forkhead associated (FHA) protein
VEVGACRVCGYRLQEAGSTNRGGMKCARCGSPVPGGYDFCSVCGLDQRERHARPVTEIMHIDKGQSQPPPGDGPAGHTVMAPSQDAPAAVPHPPGAPMQPASPTGTPPLGMPGPQHPAPPAGPPPAGPPPVGPGPDVAAASAAPAHAAPAAPANVTGRTVFAEYVPRAPEVGEADLTVPVPGRVRTDLPAGSSPSEPGLDPAISYTAGMRPAEERFPTIPEGGGAGAPQPATLSGEGQSASLSGEAQVPQPATLPGQGGYGNAAQAQWGPAVPSSRPTAPGASSPRLVLVRRDGSEGEAFPITSQELVIGRSRGTITFPDDTFMSPMHARLEQSGDRFSIVDVGSRNGVYLRVSGTASVYPGDLFMVGHQLLRLESVPHSPVESPPDVDGTYEFGTPLQPAWGRLVLIGRGGLAGDVYHLRASEVVFGRESGDVVFPGDPFVSREHARLRLEIETSSMAVYLEDMRSANGTYIRIRGSVEVRPGDSFRVGDQILRLRVDT